MVQAEFVFPPFVKRQVLKSILALSGLLHPTRMSVGEDEPGIVVCDDLSSLDRLDTRESGFFLKNKYCSYNIDIIQDLPIKVSCFLDVPASHIKIFVGHLAESRPEFGFACSPDEREAKNRVRHHVGVNTIDSWVGRNIDRSLPGLYWWTLISSSLAEKHGIPIAALSNVALEHVEAPGALHLFRFYEAPEGWREATDVRKLTAKLPGIFDVEKAREAMASAKTFPELSAVYRQWK